VVNRIFVVEDDISICEMVDNYLVSEDFRVNVFHSGSEAIRAFRLNTDYALALIDLMLPDTSGMEVIKAIRQISKVPIIIITAIKSGVLPRATIYVWTVHFSALTEQRRQSSIWLT